MEPLVSVITPCYNGESYLARYMDSLLEQTYNNVEFILINDGSNDKTEQIALSYQNQFQRRGFKFIYIYQKNAGQAAAVNQGLKIVTGKYLIWPDSDDILEKDSIKVRVEYLEKNPDKGMVAGKCKVVDEKNLNKVIDLQYNSTDDNWVENLYFSGKYSTLPGIYMVRLECLFNIYPEKQIFESREDQNFQILLPMAYYYPYGRINNFVYKYVVRQSSHSHMKRTINELILRSNNFIILARAIIELFDDEEYKKVYFNKVYNYEKRDQFIYSIQFDDINIVEECYQTICARKICSYKDRLKYWRYRVKMFFINKLNTK